MTDMLIPTRRTVVVPLALSAALLLAVPASASGIKPPSSKSKLLSDDKITIVIIDGDEENRSSSKVPAPKTVKPADLAPEKLRPSARIERDDADIKITVNRDSGPKIIIIDGTSTPCSGGGVCVIKP